MNTYLLYILTSYLKLIISGYNETERLRNDLTNKIAVNKNYI